MEVVDYRRHITKSIPQSYVPVQGWSYGQF